jgi:transposase InsO family protein
VQNEFETTIKKVRSDNRSEFKNTRIDDLCDEYGIRHQFLAKYTPQSNGLVERKNRTLIDMARSMLSEYNVSHFFWAEAINMACFCSNHLYCHQFLENTPYEILNGRKPNIAYFRVFGCKCYILKKGTRLSKFEKKCDEAFLLGIPLLASLIEFGIWLVVLLRRFMRGNLMKPMAPKRKMRI